MINRRFFFDTVRRDLFAGRLRPGQIDGLNAILDRFDALTNDITVGLPAEIAARRKQYEYYRDKLLSF